MIINPKTSPIYAKQPVVAIASGWVVTGPNSGIFTPGKILKEELLPYISSGIFPKI
jgi:hypothetical protein